MFGIFLRKEKERRKLNVNFACMYSILFCDLLTLSYSGSEPIEYAATTSTSVVCDHLQQYHTPEYVDICKKHGWPVKIKVKADAEGEVCAPWPAFTLSRFKSTLVNWIVANDQVSIWFYFRIFNLYYIVY
jgi:hypothetical protein